MLEDLASRTHEERKLAKVELIGCEGVSRAEKKAIQLEFSDLGIEIKLFEDGEDGESGDDEDEEDEDYDSGDNFDLEKLASLEEQLQSLQTSLSTAE